MPSDDYDEDMARILNVEEEVTRLEYDLARIKLVRDTFPKFKLQINSRNKKYLFSDMSVKRLFTDIEVHSYGSMVSYSLVTKLELKTLSGTEEVIVHAIPGYQNLISIKYDYNKRNADNTNWAGSIVCSPLFTCKDKERKKKAQSTFRVAILDFIKANPGYPLDEANLDPRIKKLLIFT